MVVVKPAEREAEEGPAAAAAASAVAKEEAEEEEEVDLRSGPSPLPLLRLLRLLLRLQILPRSPRRSRSRLHPTSLTHPKGGTRLFWRGSEKEIELERENDQSKLRRLS